jgi:hypothetical protein
MGEWRQGEPIPTHQPTRRSASTKVEYNFRKWQFVEQLRLGAEVSAVADSAEDATETSLKRVV